MRCAIGKVPITVAIGGKQAGGINIHRCVLAAKRNRWARGRRTIWASYLVARPGRCELANGPWRFRLARSCFEPARGSAPASRSDAPSWHSRLWRVLFCAVAADLDRRRATTEVPHFMADERAERRHLKRLRPAEIERRRVGHESHLYAVGVIAIERLHDSQRTRRWKYDGPPAVCPLAL